MRAVAAVTVNDGLHIQQHPPGRYCVTLWGVDALGRPGPAATRFVDVPAVAARAARRAGAASRSG